VIGYRLLGPLEVTVDGTAVDLGGLKQRALLAILLLHANQPVHRNVLVDRLWGEHPPAGAEHAVNVYIWRLRKTLQTASATEGVVTRQGAYLLQAAEEQVDVALFERLADEGRRALSAGPAGRASAVLGEALALWRGAPLADFRFEPFAQAEIARLEELRAGVVEDRIEADLALGRHAHLVSELEALVAADPLRERLHQQLMIALYRCGRQADALAAYQKARRTLAEELGIEPCQPLQQLERAILEQDPSLQPPPATESRWVPTPGNGRRRIPAVAGHPKRMLAVTGAAAAVAALLAGSLATLPAGGGVLVPSLASHRGGTLTLIAQLSPHDQATDPAAAYAMPLWQMLSVTNDGLVGYRRTGGPAGDTLVPDLATTLPAPVDGGRTYIFHLRPGIRYSNGTPVRPEDFRHAIERGFAINAGPASYYTGIVGAAQCQRAPARCNLARGIVTSDRAGTVTFHLTAPDPEFLYKLAFPLADAVPAGTPDHQVGPAQLPATGPYMTQSFVPRHRWVLVRNPRFHEWSGQAQPGGYPSRIILRLDISPGPAVTAVEQNRAVVLLSPPQARIQELATRYPSQLHSGPEGATIGLVLNTRVWPFNVLAARQALNYAIDRALLIRLIDGPLMAQPTCQILPPAMPGYRPYCPYTVDPSPNGAWLAPDLARAEQLVRASGTRGAKVTVTGAFGMGIPVQSTGRYLVSVLNQLGYRASLQVVTGWNAYNRRLYDSRQRMQVGWFGWYQDYPAPSDFISPLLTCHSFLPGNPANLNAAEFCNQRIDAQAKEALALQPYDPSAAWSLWARIDHEIVGWAPWVPVYNPRTVVVLSAHVGNYQFDPYWPVLVDQLWVH
jgi:peptide/nickel transport system substrate-binding protein